MSSRGLSRHRSTTRRRLASVRRHLRPPTTAERLPCGCPAAAADTACEEGPRVLAQLESEGFCILPGFVEPHITAAVRAHLDTIVPQQLPGALSTLEEAKAHGVHEIRHPIPGKIMATLASHPRTLALARYLIRSPDLRMREQILSRTDPVPPPPDRPITASSFHIDAPFLREEFEATPRQVYWQSILYCSDVAPGQANIRLIPRSHHRTLAANRDPAEAGRQRFTEAANINWPSTESPGIEGITTSDAIEVSARDGTLVLFNPMLLRERNPCLCAPAALHFFLLTLNVSCRRRLLPQPHSDFP